MQQISNSIKWSFILVSSIFSFLICTLQTNKLIAQTASKYPITISSGTYNSISGTGTYAPDVLINDSCVNIIGLSPGIILNGVTYTKAVMHNNGYLLLYSTSFTLPIRYYDPNIFLNFGNPVLSPFSMDLDTSTVATSSAYYQTIGSEHIFEWKNFSRRNNGDDILNFQIRLNASTGEIKFVYGNCNQGSGTESPRVSWKTTGNTWATDVNCIVLNELGSPVNCDWSYACTGFNFSSNAPTMYFKSAYPAMKPNTGLTYTWTPQNVVSPVRTFAAVSSITGNGATLSWTAPVGATQYNVQYRLAGTSCTWTNWIGNPISSNSVTLTGLLQNTAYQIRVQAINGSNQTVYSHTPNQNGFGSYNFNGYTQTGTFKTLQVPCIGTPIPGNTIASNMTPCPGTQVLFSLQNAAILGSGVIYQWYNNAGAIPGANSSTLLLTINSTDDIYCDVTCGGLIGSSNLVTITLNDFYNCTCASSSNNTSGEDIYQVAIAGNTINSIYTNGNGCSTPAPGPGSILHRYSNFKTLGSLATITFGDIVPFEFRQNECDGSPYTPNGIAAWIDFNHNGNFTDPGEQIYVESTPSACTGNSPLGDKVISGSFTVPFSSVTGTTVMRVICVDGMAGSSVSPCVNYNNGETEDYLITINNVAPCAGIPNPGNTIASSNVACLGSTITCSLQNNIIGTGVSYQWYNSAGLIAGATGSTFVPVINSNNQFYCVVTCGGSTVNSNPVSISIDNFINCYCISSSLSGTSGGYYGWISNVHFGSINNLSAFSFISPYHTNYPPTSTTTTSVIPGSTYTLSVNVNSGYSQAAVWFDWNQNSIFDSTEYISLGSNNTATYPSTFTQSILIPTGIPSGQIKMRIRTENYGYGLNGTNACTLLNFGETEDYTITVNSLFVCTGNPPTSNTLASTTMACPGTLVHFSLQNPSYGYDIHYNWINNSGIISGATDAYYSQVMNTNDIVYCEIKCGSSGAITTSFPVSVMIDSSSACQCQPNSNSGTLSGVYGWISNVNFGSISNVSSFPTSSPFYTNYLSTSGSTANVIPGNTYPLAITLHSGFSKVAAWFDWDQNGVFDSSEYIFIGINNTSSSTITYTELINVPYNLNAGQVKLRIRTQRNTFPLLNTDACTILEYGETEDYTILVDAVANCATSMGGYFTIDQTQPSGGNNFASFFEAAVTLSCGINAPVTIAVTPGTGPYNEQIIISEIPGSSLTNTVTFLGNNEELTYLSTMSFAPYTLLLEGASYVRFKNLKVSATSTQYAIATKLQGGANHNIFTNCIFSAPLDIPLVISNPFNIAISSFNGLAGSNNILNGCTTNGGNKGVVFNGGSANKIQNSFILDAPLGISLSNENGTIITNNLIEHPSAYMNGGTGCIIDIGCKNILFEKNKIRNFFTACPACLGGSFIGVEVNATSTIGNENIISNNLISDITKTNGPQTGIHINTSANYTRVYHNTISLEDSLTGGAGGTLPLTNGIKCEQLLTGVQINNNIVSIARGGLGPKACINILSLSGVSCNNNSYYMHSNTGLSNYIGGTLTGTSFVGYLTLSAWQAANGSSWDQQSVIADPNFTNISLYDYHPSNIMIDNIGANIGITSDMNGMARNMIHPDPGCYEFTAQAADIGVVSFVSPDSNGCYSSSTPVIVSIKNFGYNPIDFNTTPGTVSCGISGAINTTISTTINSGTLAPGSSMNVTLPTINMNTIGTYIFSPTTAMVSDTNTINNSYPNSVIRSVGPIGGSISSSPNTICVSFLPTLTLSGYYGGSLQWQQSTISATGPWSNIGSGNSIYIPSSPITQTTWYRVKVSCNSSFAYSNTYTMSVISPQVISTSNGSRCGYGSVTLNAAASSGSMLNWYLNPSDLIPAATGNSFTTPSINASTNFYVSASTGGGVSNNLSFAPASFISCYGFLFDINVMNPLRIDSISLNAATLGTQIHLYYRAGSGISYNSSSAGWTYLGAATINTLTSPLSVLPINLNLHLQPGIYSFAMTSNFPIKYSTGLTIGNPSITDGNLQIMEGFKSSLGVFNFSGAATKWNGNIRYTTSPCESPKSTVTAIVNSSPPIIASAANPTLCPGGTTSISVNSPTNPNYTYSWTSTPTGFVANGAGPFSVSPASTTTYTVTAIDNSSGTYSGCGNLSTITVITGATLATGSIISSLDTICISGFPTLTASGASGGSIQWQSSLSSTGPWINVGSGLPTYTPSTAITQTTYYRIQISCQSTSLTSGVKKVLVINPSANILSTTSGTVCGMGSAILSATAKAGSTPHWYDTPTGGVLLGTGNTFNTPPITTNTNFYVSAQSGIGGTATAVMPSEFMTASAVVKAEGYWFTAPTHMTITGLNVPLSGILTGTMQNIAIVKFSGGLPPPLSYFTNSFTTIYQTQNNPSLGMIACSVAIDSGDVIGILGERSGVTSVATPINGPVPVAIDGAYVDFFPLASNYGIANNPPTDLKDNNIGGYFGRIGRIEFEYHKGECSEIRTPVMANVLVAPAITLNNASPTICAGGSSILSVTSANDPNYTYTWYPGFHIGSTYTVSPTMNTIYTLIALDNTTGSFANCSMQSTTTVNVNPSPNANPIMASDTSICAGDMVTLSVSIPTIPSYCNAGSNTNGCTSTLVGYYISNVHLGGINNNSYCGVSNNYQDFTSLSTTLTAGNTYPMTVSVGQFYSYDSFWIWIDYNHDGLFDNVTERTTLNSAITATGNIHVPITALNGLTRMRVRVGYSGPTYVFDQPCGFATYGEVEDYSINIIGGVVSPYTWSPSTYLSNTIGANVTSVGMNASTTYTVTTTNANGCTSTSTKTILVNPTTSSTTNITIPCGTSYTWNGNTYGVTGNYTFSTLNIMGCDSISTLHLTVNCNTTINLTCFIEGYMSNPSQMTAVLSNQMEPTTSGACDSIDVELHSAISPYNLQYMTRTVLNQNGNATCVFPLVSGNKYIVVKHRNAIETWSSQPVLMDTIVNYNFSSASSKAYGNNQVLISSSPMRYAFYSGDIVQDENIDLLDIGELELAINNFMFGYISSDLNGDGNVDLLDTLIIESNTNNFIFSNHP